LIIIHAKNSLFIIPSLIKEQQRKIEKTEKIEKKRSDISASDSDISA